MQTHLGLAQIEPAPFGLQVFSQIRPFKQFFHNHERSVFLMACFKEVRDVWMPT
jgi:hypothetical protein